MGQPKRLTYMERVAMACAAHELATGRPPQSMRQLAHFIHLHEKDMWDAQLTKDAVYRARSEWLLIPGTLKASTSFLRANGWLQTEWQPPAGTEAFEASKPLVPEQRPTCFFCGGYWMPCRDHDRCYRDLGGHHAHPEHWAKEARVA